MSVITKLASSQGLNDESANIALATEIAEGNDKKAVAELITLLQHKSKHIQSDAIKVLYETGALAPKLLVPHTSVFVSLLSSTNNRLVWGAMTALDEIAHIAPADIAGALDKIMNAADKGSVIAKDHAMSILVKLSMHKQYAGNALATLLERLAASPDNQFAMYAENIVTVIPSEMKPALIAIVETRLKAIAKESQQKRLQKLLKKLHK